jgi:hypothetical protein
MRKRPTVHHQEPLKKADAGILVFDLAHADAVVGEKIDAGARRRRVDVKPATPAWINGAAQHEIDHGAIAVERRRSPQRK